MGYMGTARAYRNLIALLEGINGTTGGYYTDLSGRVYRRLLTPADLKLAKPYVCVVMTGQDFDYREDEGRGFRLHWELEIFGFVDETINTEVHGVAGENTLNLHDDIVKAWFADQTLGGAANQTFLKGGGAIAGMDEKYGELQMRVEIVQWLTPEGIGP